MTTDKKFSTVHVVRLFTIFIVAFSMLSLSASTAGLLHLPNIPTVRAVQDRGCGGIGPFVPCPWYPAGPFMDTNYIQVFTSANTELTCLQQSPPCIDIMDAPVPVSNILAVQQSTNIVITNPMSQHDYFDVQFMLANTFWGCAMNYGNSNCGIEIRQGIAHLIDRANFALNAPSIGAGSSQSTQGTPVDNPEPVNNGGLPSSNPCAWDKSFPETGSHCIVGAPGGTAFHLTNATGADGYPWLQAPGSPDFCAAADHFIHAGIATGKDSNCILTGINSTATSSGVPNFFIRNDDPARLALGNSLAANICKLFTNSYAEPCTYLTTTPGNILSFPGFDSPCNGVCNSWHMYTGSYTDVYPFDKSLFSTYNSRFVNGISPIKAPNGPQCSSSSVPSFEPPNYMYLCNTKYDSLSNQMEYAPCFAANGDPSPGQSTVGPGGGICPNTNQYSMISAGYYAEDQYGNSTYSIPVFTTTSQFAYLSNWQHVIPSDGGSVANYFTWLNAYSSNPATAGTIRQGFAQDKHSLDPYVASTQWDFYLLRNIYDSLNVQNPLDNTQIMNWMTVSEQQLTTRTLTYVPPVGTTLTMRYTLRNDLFFQDGKKVSSFDVAFSYLSLLGTGAFQGSVLSDVIGITLLGPSQFDINLGPIGPDTLRNIGTVTILPGRYWTNNSTTWDNAVNSCNMNGTSCYPAQYTLGSNGVTPTCTAGGGFSCSFPASNFNWDPNKITANYDPISNHILIGSGPWQCSSGSGLGQTCLPCGGTTCGANVPLSYTLTRFGKGLAPASSTTQIYFRSNGNLALWIWSQDTGDLTHDFLNFSVVAACFGKPTDPLGSTSNPCDHFQQGIGANGGPTIVGLGQVSIVNRFVGLNWVAPYNWNTSPPNSIVLLDPVLNEGSYTLNPSSLVGCNNAYPTGGYDC